MTPLRLTYEITPHTAEDLRRVISEIESETGILPVSIGCDGKEYPLTPELGNLDTLLHFFF